MTFDFDRATLSTASMLLLKSFCVHVVPSQWDAAEDFYYRHSFAITRHELQNTFHPFDHFSARLNTYLVNLGSPVRIRLNHS